MRTSTSGTMHPYAHGFRQQKVVKGFASTDFSAELFMPRPNIHLAFALAAVITLEILMRISNVLEKPIDQYRTVQCCTYLYIVMYIHDKISCQELCSRFHRLFCRPVYAATKQLFGIQIGCSEDFQYA